MLRNAEFTRPETVRAAAHPCRGPGGQGGNEHGGSPSFKGGVEPGRAPAGEGRELLRPSGDERVRSLSDRGAVSFKTHFHRYWTGVRFRLVENSEVSAAITAPVGLPILCHKVLLDKDKHPNSRPCSDSSQSFPSLSLGSTGSIRGGSAQGPLTL